MIRFVTLYVHTGDVQPDFSIAFMNTVTDKLVHIGDVCMWDNGREFMNWCHACREIALFERCYHLIPERFR